MFKKQNACNEDEEDDDYEYIGNEKNEINSSINSPSSAASIKNHSSSELTTKDKKVRCNSMHFLIIQ